MGAMDAILRELRGYGDLGLTIGSQAALQPVAGYNALAAVLRGQDPGAAVEQVQGMGWQPKTPEAQRTLRDWGGWMQQAGDALGNPIDKLGEVPGVGPALAAGALGFVETADPTKAAGKAARAAKGAAKAIDKAKVPTVPRGEAAATLQAAGEGDIWSSMKADKDAKVNVPRERLDTALANRAELRAEPNVLPKPAGQMTDADWQAWGQQFGVNMTRSPDQSLGISDLTTRKEIMVPGGLEGQFTIPDLFQIKANNFDPNALPQDVHNALMAKFLRTYERPGGMDATDRFNALNFALLSPNAPLTQNEFLAQRLRATGPDDLNRIAAMTPAEARAAEMGTGAASRGGMGVKGTADLGNQPHLARILRDSPEVFDVGPGETLKDVGRRTMNQVPGLGPKTASLGVPWLDLANANTSAVDLHMIRNNFPRLLGDPELGPQFTQRVATLTGQDGANADTLLALSRTDPQFASRLEDAAINVIGGDSIGMKYRLKGGEVNPKVHPALAPEKLAFEPEQAIEFNPFYNRVVDYVDESRGPNPTLALFPEQWRLWDRYRGRVEPHEMAHPDFRKLPKMSWEEMQQALQAHKDLGYTSGNKGLKPGVAKSWGDLYYGAATPEMLGGLAAGTAGASALANLLREQPADESEAERRRLLATRP